MRLLRVVLILIIPGLIALAYVWVVDGGGELFTNVPSAFAEWTGRGMAVDSQQLRRWFIPLYLLAYMIPVIGFSLHGHRRWLKALAALASVHFSIFIGVMSQDD